jgi:hypothetical protein
MPIPNSRFRYRKLPKRKVLEFVLKIWCTFGVSIGARELIILYLISIMLFLRQLLVCINLNEIHNFYATKSSTIEIFRVC